MQLLYCEKGCLIIFICCNVFTSLKQRIKYQLPVTCGPWPMAHDLWPMTCDPWPVFIDPLLLLCLLLACKYCSDLFQECQLKWMKVISGDMSYIHYWVACYLCSVVFLWCPLRNANFCSRLPKYGLQMTLYTVIGSASTSPWQLVIL